MKKIRIESQWNGNDEVMLNIPDFPHLHAALNKNLEKYNRYPHPYEYFLSSLSGAITAFIKDFSNKHSLITGNLYIIIEGIFNEDLSKIEKLILEIKYDSNATGRQLTELQHGLLNKELILSLLKKEKIQINWN
ncbi:MAG: hypothetical protein ACOCRK_00435 [bacterium]